MSKTKVRDTILKRSSVIIFFLVILGAISLIRIALTHEDIEDIAEIDLPLIDVLTRIETNQLEQSINLERAIRYAQDTNLEIGHSNFINSDSTFRYLAKVVDEDLLDAQQAVKRAIAGTNEENHQIKLDALLLSLKKLEIDHTKFEEHAFEVLDLLEEGHIKEAIIASERVEREEDEFNKRVANVLVRHERFTEALVKIVEKEEVLSMRWIVVLTLFFVITGLILAYMYSFKIWQPLDDIREGAVELGQGKLNTRLRVRGSSMTEEIIDAFNKMADKLQHSKREIDKFVDFTYRTSHDLKAPVSNLNSLLEMLQPGMSEANQEAIINRSKEALKQLNDRIDGIAKVNNLRDKIDLEKEHLDFENELEEIKQSLIIQIKDSKAIFKTNFSVPSIDYPKAHLHSILQNLITNSIKYKDPSRPLVIEVKTYTKNEETFLQYKDTGLGFDSVKHQDRIFKAFERLHTHKPGNGLGLYIVKTIIDIHKGAIKVKSEPKKGTIFLLRLNAAQ